LKPFTIINMHKVLWTSSAVRRGMLAWFKLVASATNWKRKASHGS
jgi:hypothetical protein